jgi:SAM-dependent methyltransferase
MEPVVLMDADSVHEDVRRHYAERVQSATSCCGSGCCSAEGAELYSSEELSLVPQESATVSYGCGNPTAIASLQPGEVVLDLGSGGGIDCFLAAQRVGPAGYVYGVDMTDEMLDLARRNAARQGFTNVEFRKGYIEAIPLPDGTPESGIDVIISNCVVNLSPDKPEVFREALRVLRPGGRVAISDVVIDGTLDDLPVSEAQVRAALNWAGCIAGALTTEQVRSQMADAGFVEIGIDFKQHYTLESLGAEGSDLVGLPADVAENLARRFGSAIISARRPK